MLTILWKTPSGAEEINVTYGISKIPALQEPSEQADCGGREHVAFQCLVAVQDQENLQLHRTVIDAGDVFVMNAEGKTVATYRFPAA
jgi:hypothetical protein